MRSGVRGLWFLVESGERKEERGKLFVVCGLVPILRGGVWGWYRPSVFGLPSPDSNLSSVFGLPSPDSNLSSVSGLPSTIFCLLSWFLSLDSCFCFKRPSN